MAAEQAGYSPDQPTIPCAGPYDGRESLPGVSPGLTLRNQPAAHVQSAGGAAPAPRTRGAPAGVEGGKQATSGGPGRTPGLPKESRPATGGAGEVTCRTLHDAAAARPVPEDWPGLPLAAPCAGSDSSRRARIDDRPIVGVYNAPTRGRALANEEITSNNADGIVGRASQTRLQVGPGRRVMASFGL